MRIALVVERFVPSGGGVEQAAWQVAHELARAGDEVTVVAREGELGPSGEASEAEDPIGLTLARVSVPTGWQPLRVLAFSRASAGRLRRAKPPFDVIHSFTRTRHQDVYRAGAGSHAEYLRRAHGPAGARLRRLSPRHRVLLAAEARIFGDPKQLVQCVSRMVRDELARRFDVPGERLVVLYNGVDHRRFDRALHDGEGRDLRARHGDEQGTVWLLAGSGSRRKGIDTALEALAACADERASLWIAGRDETAPWRARARALGVEGRVRFLGPRDDLPAVYAAADALLHPARYDPFANVCLEAAASGLPVVSSGANGAVELVSDGAIVVEDPEDVAGFARAMERLTEPDLRRALGERGRKIAVQNSWEAHVVKLRELYAEVVARRGGPGQRTAGQA